MTLCFLRVGFIYSFVLILSCCQNTARWLGRGTVGNISFFFFKTFLNVVAFLSFL